jgi:hypothetical protein
MFLVHIPCALLVACTVFVPLCAVEDFVLPADAGAVNVRSHGAAGDGVTDDTAAIRAAIAATVPPNDGGNPNNGRMLYFPNGTYLVSDTISWQRWIRIAGQSRDGTIIRLKNGSAGFNGTADKPVLRCYYSNNTTFANYIDNLTIDIGTENPSATGLRYNNHNEGAVRNIRIRSTDRGRIGLDMTENEFGPGLIKDVTIEGFARGVVTVGSVSHATFENLTLIGQSALGFENNLPVSIRNLVSINTVPALQNNAFYLAHAVVVGATLSGGATTHPAIINNGGLYLRDASASGYARLLRENGANRSGLALTEYISSNDERVGAFADECTGHLRLPIETPPAPVLDAVTAWVKPADGSGVRTAAVQAAFNSGASTVYLRYYGDVNWGYRVDATIRVPATVKRIVSIHSEVSSAYGYYQDYLDANTPVMRIEGDTTEPLVIENVRASRYPYNAERPGFDIASNRPVFFKSCGGANIRALAGYTGKIWLEDTHCGLEIRGTQHVWASHYNMENNPSELIANRTYVTNAGGAFWCLGMKTESFAVHVDTTAGGSSEILGGFFRDHGPRSPDTVAFFRTRDARTTATYISYAWADGQTRGLHGVEQRGAVTQECRLPLINHRIGLYAAAPGASRAIIMASLSNYKWQASAPAGAVFAAPAGGSQALTILPNQPAVIAPVPVAAQ